MFKELHEILIAIPLLLASVSSIIDKIRRLLRYKRERQNGGTVREHLGRIESELREIREQQRTANLRLRKLENKGYIDISPIKKKPKRKIN